MKKNKKADFIWISWVLLMAFAVALSAMMYNWIFNYTKSSAEKIEERALNSQECSYIGISIDSYCQDTKNIYLDITNRNNLKVDNVLVRMYDVYNDPVSEAKEEQFILEPGKTAKLTVVKNGLVKTVEVVPATIKGKTEIICTNRVAKADDINSASANCT